MDKQLCSLTLQRQDTKIVASLIGEIDLSNAYYLGSQLREAIPSDIECVLLDLNKVEYLDSSGVHMLFVFGERLTRHRQKLVLILDSKATIYQLMERLDISGVAQLYPSKSLALSSI